MLKGLLFALHVTRINIALLKHGENAKYFSPGFRHTVRNKVRIFLKQSLTGLNDDISLFQAKTGLLSLQNQNHYSRPDTGAG
jgi:hypothetical protein